MNRVRRHIVLAVLFAVLLAAPALQARAEIRESGTCGAALAWTLDDQGTLTISGSGEMEDYTGPADVPWSACRAAVRKVVLEDGVETIGAHAFDTCYNLVEAEMTGSVRIIGEYAFNSCTRLIGAGWQEGLAEIKDSAYSNCTALTEAELPDSLKKAGRQVFMDCDNLKKLVIPGGVEDFRGLAFYKMEEIVLKDGITAIPESAFRYSNMTSITIPDSVLVIEKNAFADCTKLTSVTIPAGVKTIPEYAFYGCPMLETVRFPAGLTEIRSDAFFGCTALREAVLPEGLESIGDRAFYSCGALKEAGLPEGVESIGNYAFSACSSLTGITLPQSLADLGKAAFSNCTGLTVIEIPSGVTVIKEDTFSGCSSLTSVTIPEGVTEIGEEAFEKCTSLEQITFPDSATKLGGSIFRGCTSLRTFTVPEGVTALYGTFRGCSSLASVTIPDTVSVIGSYAFYACKSLKRLELPAGLRSIEVFAFRETTRLVLAYPGPEALWDTVRLDGSHSLYATVVFNDFYPSAKAELSATELVYNGKARKPAVTVRAGDTVLKEGKDYTLAWENNVNAGTATVRVTGTGAYAGEITEAFFIKRAEQPLAVTAASYVAVGKTTVVKVEGAVGKLHFTSSDTKTATVGSPSGKVKGIAPGQVTITVMANKTDNYLQTTRQIKVSVKPAVLPFTDVKPADSFYKAVEWAFYNGIVMGKSETVFAPDAGITRGEFCTMLWRMWGRQEVTAEEVSAMPFADAKASNHKKGIAWCYGKKIITGYTVDGKKVFKPSAKISRTNILVMLFKMGKKEAGYQPATIGNPFTDVKNSNKNIGAFKWAYQYGIVTGKKLEPSRRCTRAEMVGFLYGYNGTYKVVK